MAAMKKDKRYRNDFYLRCLGNAVRNRRIDLLFSQDMLSARCNLHRTYVTDLESGFRNLSLLTLVKVSVALSLPLSQLIKDTELLMALGEFA
jgi:transcriptional regulator with XRE-family HTH domain